MNVLTASDPRQCTEVQASMDTYPEYDEIFSVSVNLQNSLDYVTSPQYVNVTIVDDDGKYLVSYSNRVLSYQMPDSQM